MTELLQLIGTIGGIVGALFVSVKKPFAGQGIWLFSNICWVTYGSIEKNWYIVTLFGVYLVICVIGLVNYRPGKDESCKFCGGQISE